MGSGCSDRGKRYRDGPRLDVNFLLYEGDGLASYDDADLGGVIVATHHVGSGTNSQPSFDLTSSVQDFVDSGVTHLGLNLRSTTEGTGYDEEWLISSDLMSGAFSSPRLFLSLVLH